MEKPTYSLCRDFRDFVVLDFETTGFGETAGVTELGAVKVECGDIVDTFSTLVDPGVPIPPFITALTGISDEMVRGKPPAGEAVRRFLEFTGGKPIVAHNAPFDCYFLLREAERLGIPVPNPLVDTLRLARRVWPRLPSYKLPFLTEYFCILHDVHHRALSDAEATAKLYLMMRET